uniref:Ig-like domain-containing protein n=1 Tax=Cyprinus carpio TaxID=7962 RepID=A0A8C2HJ78_CYPCA
MWVYFPLLLSALAGENVFLSILILHINFDLITSHDSEKQAQDGNNVTLSCNYTGTVYNLLWYRQYQRSKPELLFMTESGDPVKEDPSADWLFAKVDKLRKLMKLEISPATGSDSAQYYCALQPTLIDWVTAYLTFIQLLLFILVNFLFIFCQKSVALTKLLLYCGDLS